MMDWLGYVSGLAIPLMVVGILSMGLARRVAVYEEFVEGAREGVHIVVGLLPYLLGMYVAITVFRQSGALELLLRALAPLAQILGVPLDVLPLAFLRPLSGAAALGALTDILTRSGPDTLVGNLASVMQGSTETTFYILTVYFGSVGIERYRHALPVGLGADLLGFVASVVVVRLLFL